MGKIIAETPESVLDLLEIRAWPKDGGVASPEIQFITARIEKFVVAAGLIWSTASDQRQLSE